MPTARSSNQPANIKREDHVLVSKNISDDLHTDKPMMTSAKDDIMPIVQRVQRNIIGDRPIQCNNESNETTEPVHAKVIANRDTLTNFENNDTIINLSLIHI